MIYRLFLLIFLLVPIGSHSAEPTCEAQRDRVQIRLEMARETLERREAQLADLVVRYGQLEAELKALRTKKPAPEKTE